MAESRKRDSEHLMSKSVTYAEYMNMLAERVVDNRRQLKKSVHQRRNGMEDLYGVCFSAHATEPNDNDRYEAKFYISLSPDYVYLHRLAFKFVVMPSITEDTAPSAGDDWIVKIANVDITGYLKEQQGVDPDAPLFSGEGVYPSNNLTDTVENFYDILDVVSVMIAEGEDDNANAIIAPKFKPVIISAKKPFSIDSYLYAKYSTINR